MVFIDNQLKIRILITGVNPISLGIGEYLNRSNYYHEFLIIGEKYIASNPEEEYLLNTLPILIGIARIVKNKFEIIDSINNNKITIEPSIKVFTQENPGIEKNPNKLNIYLIDKEESVMVSPNILLNIDDNMILRKTGLIMGNLLVRHLQGEEPQQIDIESNIPLIPKKIAVKTFGALWYLNIQGFRKLKIGDQYYFKLDNGVGIITYRNLVFKESIDKVKAIALKKND